jgi:hypothetical protein
MRWFQFSAFSISAFAKGRLCPAIPRSTFFMLPSPCAPLLGARI